MMRISHMLSKCGLFRTLMLGEFQEQIFRKSISLVLLTFFFISFLAYTALPINLSFFGRAYEIFHFRAPAYYCRLIE